MRYEPPIDRARLVELVREVYGVVARRLLFIPLGFDGVCYDVHGAGGERYVLKLWPASRVGSESAARRYGALTLARALHDRGLLSRLPYPIQTCTGALWAELSGMPLALY